MAPNFVTADSPVIYYFIARTEKGILKGYYPLLQSRRGCDDLKRGARFISVIDSVISPHLISGILYL